MCGRANIVTVKKIPIARAAYLRHAVDILADAGSTADVTAYGLPRHATDGDDAYIPVVFALRFLDGGGRQAGLPSLPFQVAQRIRLNNLDPRLAALLRHRSTLFGGLKLLCELATLEGSFVRMWLERAGDRVRVCSRVLWVPRSEPRIVSQWLQNGVGICLVRHYLGTTWTPATLAFEDDYIPTADVLAAFPNTAFRARQPASWFDVPLSALATEARPGPAAGPVASAQLPDEGDIVGILRLVLRSYLGEDKLPVSRAAALVGRSTRTLQRELGAAGVSYSALLDEVRFTRAAELLRNTDERIIVIGQAVGYDDPAHFTRAFRRVGGVTPRAYRANAAGEASPRV